MKKASDILKEAASVIEERGKLRDKDDGERSMSRAVAAYNALCGPRLDSELSGWLFMICLKMARATAGKTHEDDYADICGYGALAAECVLSKKDRKEALDELTRISEEIGLYTVREHINDIEWKMGAEIPSGNEDLSKYADPYTGEIKIPSKENDWIEWKGGECPVDLTEKVEVVLRQSGKYAPYCAGSWVWWHDGAGDDIIAYRVVKE